MTAVNVQDELGAAEAGETLLSFAITIAEGKDVPVREYRAVHKRLFESPTARRVGQKGLRKYATPDLLWGYLRSQASGTGSWKLRREAAHALIDPIVEASSSRRVSASNRESWSAA